MTSTQKRQNAIEEVEPTGLRCPGREGYDTASDTGHMISQTNDETRAYSSTRGSTKRDDNAVLTKTWKLLWVFAKREGLPIEESEGESHSNRMYTHLP
jgi:hypothetical protein